MITDWIDSRSNKEEIAIINQRQWRHSQSIWNTSNFFAKTQIELQIGSQKLAFDNLGTKKSQPNRASITASYWVIISCLLSSVGLGHHHRLCWPQHWRHRALLMGKFFPRGESESVAPLNCAGLASGQLITTEFCHGTLLVTTDASFLVELGFGVANLIIFKIFRFLSKITKKTQIWQPFPLTTSWMRYAPKQLAGANRKLTAWWPHSTSFA